MKRIEIEIMRTSDALNAAIDTWHIAESGKQVAPRLSFGSIKDLFSAITEKRLELLRYVAEQKEVLNIRQLTKKQTQRRKSCLNLLLTTMKAAA